MKIRTLSSASYHDYITKLYSYNENIANLIRQVTF